MSDYDNIDMLREDNDIQAHNHMIDHFMHPRQSTRVTSNIS